MPLRVAQYFICMFSFLLRIYLTVDLLDYRITSFPGGSVGKESACNAEDAGSIPRSGRSPGGGHSNPLQHSCLENPHGQRNLVGH